MTLIHRSNPSTFHGVMQIIYSAIYHRGGSCGEKMDGGSGRYRDGDGQLVSCFVELASCDHLRKADETAYDVIQTCLYEEKMYR